MHCNQRYFANLRFLVEPNHEPDITAFAVDAGNPLRLVDQRMDEGYVTPVEVAGDDPVYVSRIREDYTVENGLCLWVVADNLRKGAALNAVQIAEVLVGEYL